MPGYCPLKVVARYVVRTQLAHTGGHRIGVDGVRDRSPAIGRVGAREVRSLARVSTRAGAGPPKATVASKTGCGRRDPDGCAPRVKNAGFTRSGLCSLLYYLRRHYYITCYLAPLLPARRSHVPAGAGEITT